MLSLKIEMKFLLARLVRRIGRKIGPGGGVRIGKLFDFPFTVQGSPHLIFSEGIECRRFQNRFCFLCMVF